MIFVLFLRDQYHSQNLSIQIKLNDHGLFLDSTSFFLHFISFFKAFVFFINRQVPFESGIFFYAFYNRVLICLIHPFSIYLQTVSLSNLHTTQSFLTFSILIVLQNCQNQNSKKMKNSSLNLIGNETSFSSFCFFMLRNFYLQIFNFYVSSYFIFIFYFF